MELRHIRYFLAVASTMNFTKAAEELCIAQPPLSRQIKDLEEELGVTLFIRKPHSLTLTEAGLLFKQYALQIMALVDKSVEEVREFKTGLQGMLYLSSVDGHAPGLLAHWISDFHKENPHVQYNLWNGNSDDVIRRVANGLCELAVIVEPHNAEGMNSLSVYSEPWVAIIPTDTPLANQLAEEKRDTVDIMQLLPYDLIIPSRSSRLDEINSWFPDENARPKVVCRMSHLLSAYELSREGVGITIYPASAGDFFQNTKDSSITIKEIVNPNVSASYSVIWDKYRPLSNVASAFLEFLRTEVTNNNL